MFSAVLDVVLRATHVFAVAIQHFLREWSFREPMLVDASQRRLPSGSSPLPVDILCAVQKRSHSYFRRFMDSGSLPSVPPPFNNILVAIEHDKWQQPRMPIFFKDVSRFVVMCDVIPIYVGFY